MVHCLDKEGVLHEGQAGFRVNRSCLKNVYTLNEIVQGRLKEDKETYTFFLDVQKAYDTVWRECFSNSPTKPSLPPVLLFLMHGTISPFSIATHFTLNFLFPIGIKITIIMSTLIFPKC